MKTLIGPKERDFLFCVKSKFKYIYKTTDGIVLCCKRDAIFENVNLVDVIRKKLFKNLVTYKVYKIYDLLFEYDSSCIH